MRIEGWENVLQEYIEQARSLSFVWGENDCCLWASKFVDSITGTTYADDWLGFYDDEEGANALMALRGFNYPHDIVNSHLPKIQVSAAKRGDLVMNKDGCIGICDGRKSFFLAVGRGLVADETLSCRRAWKV